MSPASAPNVSQPSKISSPFDAVRARPLVVLTVGFAVGIALGEPVRQFPRISAALAGAAVVAVLIVSYRDRARLLGLLPLALIAAGALWCVALGTPPRRDVSRLLADLRVAGHVVQLRGTVISELETTAAGQRFYLEAEELSVGGWRQPTAGIVLMTTGPERPLSPGTRIVTRTTLAAPDEAGNPGQLSRRRLLARAQVFATAHIADDTPIRVLGARRSAPALWVVRLRSRMLERTRATMPGPYRDLAAQLLFSVTYGMQSTPLPEPVVEAFRTAGAVHLLVVSGSQVACFFLLLRLLAGRRPQRTLFTGLCFLGAILLLVGYYLLCSAPPARIPSLTRATLMALCLAAGALAARDVDTLTSLAAAALILLVANPQYLFSGSFQLSFAAVLGIVLLTDPLARAMRLGSSWPARLLTASLSAQLMTAPLLLHYFGRVSVIGLVSNVVLVPLAAALIPLGLAGSLAALCCEPLAALLNTVNYHGVLLLYQLTAFFADVPYATVELARWNATDVTFYYCGIAGIGVVATPSVREQLRWERVLVAALVVLAAFTGYQFVQALPKPLELTVLDAGDGDCLFVRSPTGRTMLIDAGTRTLPEAAHAAAFGERVVLPFLLTRKVARLDVVVLTHPHDDHMSGLPAVLRRLPVGLLLEAGEPVTAPNYQAVLDLVRDRRIPYRIARRGQTLNLGGGARAFVLSPLEPRLRNTANDLNNNSVAIKLVYGRFSALLSGDLEAEAETRLVRRGDRLQSTVLKAGHHGSRTSSTAEFLRTVRPQVTFISCEPTLFQHPAPATLARFAAVGTRVYRTDLRGALTVHSDGTRYRVSTFQDGVVQDWQPCAPR